MDYRTTLVQKWCVLSPLYAIFVSAYCHTVGTQEMFVEGREERRGGGTEGES